jgi:hypothetical protein
MEASTTFTKTSSTKKTTAITLVNDYLYCVNEAKELFQIDPQMGNRHYYQICLRVVIHVLLIQPINWCIQ